MEQFPKALNSSKSNPKSLPESRQFDVFDLWLLVNINHKGSLVTRALLPCPKLAWNPHLLTFGSPSPGPVRRASILPRLPWTIVTLTW